MGYTMVDANNKEIWRYAQVCAIIRLIGGVPHRGLAEIDHLACSLQSRKLTSLVHVTKHQKD